MYLLKLLVISNVDVSVVPEEELDSLSIGCIYFIKFTVNWISNIVWQKGKLNRTILVDGNRNSAISKIHNFRTN